MKIYRSILPVLVSFIAIPSMGQTKFNAEIYSFMGREHNVFKAPDKLFDPESQQYYGKDSLQVSDFFVDAGIDLALRKKKVGSNYFGASADYWNRMYFQYQEANQFSLSADFFYEHDLGKNIVFGAAYKISLNDKIGTSITGDELLRSYKFLGNYGDLYLIFSPGDRWEILAAGSYTFKNYVADTTETPLDHTNLDAELSISFEMNKKHGITLDLGFTDRNYLMYPASDSLGQIITEHPLRHYRYHDLSFAYKYKPVRGLLISPAFKLARRNDMYQDYYSYFSYKAGIKLRYMKKKFYAYLKTSFRNVIYDRRYAFTYLESTQLLSYKYLDYNFKVKYKIIPAMELFLNFKSDNRNSNTELEHARTRRPYNNYEMLVGITFIPFDYNSKYDR